MFAQADAADLPAAVAQGDLVLVESGDEWVLTERFDPRLSVGSSFEYQGQLWTVTWESDEGFGETAAN